MVVLADDSSTESDSGSTNEDLPPDGFLTLQRTYSSHDQDICAKTLQAMDQIRLFDMAAIQTDNSLHEDILGASDVILHFLDRVCLRPSDERRAALIIFPRLVQVDFLSVLFLHRSACRIIATDSNMSAAAGAVVCWVDVILARLAACVLVIAGGLTSAALAPESSFLKSRRDEDHVHAATQLPGIPLTPALCNPEGLIYLLERWECIAGVIGSDTTSPAAVRLATRLLFAAHVMGPQLSGLERWADPSIQPLDDISAVLRNATKRHINGLSVISTDLKYDDDERATLAMLVVIYCVGQMKAGKYPTPNFQLPTSIQSQANLLNFLQVAFSGDANCAQRTPPYEILNSAQTILVRWGSLVPWSWSMWSDQRVANVECITDLTITWLYHLNSPFCSDDTVECLPPFTTQFSSMIANEESNFGAIIVQVLNRLMIYIRESQKHPSDASTWLVVILQKACSVTAQLLRYNAERRTSPYEPIVGSICQSLQALFYYLDDRPENLNIKDIIVENLSLILHDVVISSFQTLREDDSLQMDGKIEQEISKSIAKIELLRNHSLLDDAEIMILCLSVKCTLCFVALIWHSDLNNCLIRYVSSLISKAMTLLREDSARRIPPVLGDALSTCTSITDVSMGQNTLEEVAFWDLAIQSECTNLSRASAFAYRLLVTKGRHSDDLDMAEAWNHLRDVLLLILSGRIAEEAEALALLVCPGICLALAKMVQTASSIAGFITLSPWTTSLCSELGSLIFAQRPSEVGYFVSLRRQLDRVGKVLLDQVAEKKLYRPSTSKVTQDAEWRLVYYYASTGSHLVLVPQVEE